MNTNYRLIKKWVAPFFVAIVILLILVLIFGQVSHGAKSWFGIGSFGGQPSEFAKLAVVLYLSSLIHKKGDKVRDFKTGLLPIMLIVGFVCFLIMLQPDFGSCMILVLTAGIVIVVGGANLKQILAICGCFLLALCLYVVYSIISGNTDYRIERFTSYLHPWDDPINSGLQLIQSWFALSHGGIGGAGFGQSIQKLSYLPEAHNDFIFAIIGEELGFIGCSIFLLAYLVFLWRGLIIALRSTDVFGTLVGSGIVGMIALQAIINIGGVTGALPITGITLPFISFGGSSLLATMMSVGILLSISRENSRLERAKSPEKQSLRAN